MSNAASETLDGSLAASAGASRDKGQIIDPNGLDLFRLTMMVITASICGGIFALAGDMAAGGASTGAVLISWAICFVGVFSLMMCFNGLSQARPDLTGGIYAYAAAGFGDFVGFNSAWGYWVSACLSNVSFAILLFSALGYFFHPFESGNNLLSCVCASAFLWLLVWLVSRGVKEAAGINVIVTIAKLVPLSLFVLSIALLGKFDPAGSREIRPRRGPRHGHRLHLGVRTVPHHLAGEHGRHAARADGRAGHPVDGGHPRTCHRVCRREHREPRRGAVASGRETPFEAARQGVFPKSFARTNKNGAPIVTVLISAGITQLFLIVSVFSSSTYQFFYACAVSTILIPYVCSAAYYMKIAWKREHLTPEQVKKARVFGTVGFVYTVFLVWAAGLVGIMITTILFAPGIIVYAMGQRERGEKILPNMADKAIAAVIVVLMAVSIALMATGTIQVL